MGGKQYGMSTEFFDALERVHEDFGEVDELGDILQALGEIEHVDSQKHGSLRGRRGVRRAQQRL